VVWRGVVWCGVVWCGVVWCGVAWYGVAWCGVVWRGMVWCGVVWCGVVYFFSLNDITHAHSVCNAITPRSIFTSTCTHVIQSICTVSHTIITNDIILKMSVIYSHNIKLPRIFHF
jgi:hypothetical protein